MSVYQNTQNQVVFIKQYLFRKMLKRKKGNKCSSKNKNFSRVKVSEHRKKMRQKIKNHVQ